MAQLNLFDISFPAYSITKHYTRIWEEMNVLFIKTATGTYVLDNKNLDGDTVGKRRLRVTEDKLYVPRKVYYNIGQFLKSKDNLIMDTNGNVIKYKRTKFVPLIYYKVQDVLEAEDGECILEIPNINYQYKTNCRNAYGIKYIGLLVTEYGYIPYDFSEEHIKSTRRKI